MRMLMLFLCVSLISWGGLSQRGIAHALSCGAKKSGRVLTPALKRSLSKAMSKAARQYGDDVARVVSKGGLELLEKGGGRYGDDILRLCMKNPKMLEALSRSDSRLLVPLAKRLGPQVMEFELRHPGMAVKAVDTFGDDALRLGLKMKHGDMTRLLGFGVKADSLKTRRLLWTKYAASKNGSRFLAALDWKRVMAVGLTASAVISAYKVSDGVEECIKSVGNQAPQSVVRGSVAVGLLGVLLLLGPLGFALAARVRSLGKDHASKPAVA